MGWNAGYTIFETTVVGAYDLGRLDRELLTVLMEPYRNTDIDSAGSRNLKARDGKDVQQIVIEVWGLEMPSRPDGEYDNDPDSWEDYYDKVHELFYSVTTDFGWG